MRLRDPFSVNARVISHVSRVFVQTCLYNKKENDERGLLKLYCLVLKTNIFTTRKY